MKNKIVAIPVLLIVLGLMSGNLFAQLKVYHINEGAVPPVSNGVFYSLPRTVVNIEVTIDRIEN